MWTILIILYIWVGVLKEILLVTSRVGKASVYCVPTRHIPCHSDQMHEGQIIHYGPFLIVLKTGKAYP